MIDCKRAGQLLEESEFEKIGWWKKRKLKLHLKMCHLCKKYEEDNHILSRIIKMADVRYCESCLSEQEKQQMKQRLTNK